MRCGFSHLSCAQAKPLLITGMRGPNRSCFRLNVTTAKFNVTMRKILQVNRLPSVLAVLLSRTSTSWPLCICSLTLFFNMAPSLWKRNTAGMVAVVFSSPAIANGALVSKDVSALLSAARRNTFVCDHSCKRVSFWHSNPARHLGSKPDLGPKAKFTEWIKIRATVGYWWCSTVNMSK